MNALSAPFKQLVERRLWPLALLLVAALVAVPVLLAKPAEKDVLPTPVAAVPAGQADTQAVVTKTDPAATDELRAVLGARKDPFRPAAVHRAPEPEVAGSASVATTVDTPDTGGGSSGGGSTTTPTTTDPTPAVTPTPAPEVYELYSLKVRFGPTTGQLKTRTVKRLSGLPGGVRPALLYLGLAENHKSAVFIVDAGVETLGDGHCEPAPNNCETLTLRPGETEFLTRGNKQWQLDLVKINKRRTTDAAAAAKARRSVARDGAKVARRMNAGASAYRYDAAAGTLRRVRRAPVAKIPAERSSRTTTVDSSG